MDPITAILAAGLVMSLLGLAVVGGRLRGAGDRLAEASRRAEEAALRAEELALRAGELEESLRACEVARTTAESAVIEKEQLAAIGELSAMIAHEIRNPLTIIGNAVTTLRRAGTPAEDRATLLDILEEESRRLNQLMNDLLSYARPVSLELTRVDVREIVERALSLLPVSGALEVELIEPVRVGRVLGDPKLLRQVFENLVTNAAQAMGREGGILTVRLEKGELDGLPGVIASVEDTGEGMDTSVRDRALLPFFTTRPSGTGLGLAIVARVVRAHGGKIELKSAAGKGTRVQVFLPDG
ncbi:MAG: ATP-binding protein [Polyangiaceae bacterium]